MVEFSNNQRAQVLVQALPYIKKYAGKTVVVKYGGNAMIDEGLKNDVMNDIVLMQLVGINVVLVHGGGPEINAMLKKIQKESKFLNGMRVTDQETMDIVQQVLAGKVNKDLVQRLEDAGGKAVGLCGLDGSLLKADQLDTQLGFVGEIREVNAEILQNASANGYVPIVSTVAAGYHGEVFNINADVAAARIAASLGAMKLILMTDVRGLLRDKDDESTLIPVPVIQGGMGVGISLSGLAGSVAACGGVGIISTAQIGYREPDYDTDPLEANLRAVGKEIRKARRIAPQGVIGVNIMVATREYEAYVEAAVEAGADLVISGAGLPMTLPAAAAAGEEKKKAAGGRAGYGSENGPKRAALAPIVSSRKAAEVICRYWKKKYRAVPDLLVVDGPLAGGDLGFSAEQLEDIPALHYEEEIRSILEFAAEYSKAAGK